MSTTDETVVITPCPNGPLLVRGAFTIAPEDGGEPQQPSRRVVALCRCGMTAIPPMCDGSHKVTKFRTTAPD